MYQGSTLKTGRVLAITGCALLLSAFLHLFFALKGSVIVFDASGEVVEAVVTNAYAPEQHLYRLPGATFWALPRRGEGSIEVRCRNGARKRAGYVSHGLHSWFRVVGDVPCGQVLEIH